MKKIIAVFDSLRFSESTLSYALYLSRLGNASVTGIFLEQPAHDTHIPEVISQERNAKKEMTGISSDNKVRNRNLSRFEQACVNEGISYSLRHDDGNALHRILQESAFADLVLINENETLLRYEEESPTHFIKDLLHEIHCPVVVVPDFYKAIDNIVLLYNGSPSSVHAIRTFSYLFENLKEYPTTVLTVTDHSGIIPHKTLIEEFIKDHYPAADYVLLQGIPYQAIIEYLEKRSNNTLIVIGAYERSKLSRVFRPSMADHLMSQLQLPLFIAHNRA